jgi:hypothetical protein
MSISSGRVYIMAPKPGDPEIEPYSHGYSGDFYWLCFSLVDSVSAAVGEVLPVTDSVGRDGCFKTMRGFGFEVLGSPGVNSPEFQY